MRVSEQFWEKFAAENSEFSTWKKLPLTDENRDYAIYSDAEESQQLQIMFDPTEDEVRLSYVDVGDFEDVFTLTFYDLAENYESMSEFVKSGTGIPKKVLQPLVSDQLWREFVAVNPEFLTWKEWFSKYGVNGDLVDDDDYNSWLNSEGTHAVKVMFEPERREFGSWLSIFGEEQYDDVVYMLNVVFYDVDKNLAEFSQLVKEWFFKE